MVFGLWSLVYYFPPYFYPFFCRYDSMKKDKIYQLIGRITVQFATMEHRLQGLLEMLIGDGSNIIGPMFIHDIPLSGLLKKISMLAHCRLQDGSGLLSDLERILKKVEELRDERNLLIHGDWKIEDLDTLKITVRDFKMKYYPGAWQEFSETELTEKRLTAINRRLEGLGGEVDYFVRRLSEISEGLKLCKTSTATNYAAAIRKINLEMERND